MTDVIDKAFATARAEAALRGASLIRCEDDRGGAVFVLSWGALTREARDLDEALRVIEALPRAIR